MTDIWVWNENYPADAAFGCDFLTRAARGDIHLIGPDGPEVRPEKILVTSVDLDLEGRVCLGERTVLLLAHELGMVDGWRVDVLKRDSEALRAEVVELSEELAKTRREVERLESLERQVPPIEYVALDGSTHASIRAAEEKSRRTAGVPFGPSELAIPVGPLTPEVVG